MAMISTEYISDVVMLGFSASLLILVPVLLIGFCLRVIKMW